MAGTNEKTTSNRPRRRRRGASHATAPAESNLPVWKKLVFGVVVLAVMLTALELGLAVVGVDPAIVQRDPYLGFSSTTPLFMRQRMADGTTIFRTADNKLQHFNDQRFPAEKGADTYRIFCMGGSTTHGRPYRDKTSFVNWLRRFVTDADSSTTWEVINCGGVSYASYRVALLMEELIRYEPDLFIVYTGHNEFLEYRTYDGDIAEPAPITSMRMLLRHSRIASAVGSTVAALTPDARATARQKFALTGEVQPLLDLSAGINRYHRDDTLRKQIVGHFRFNLHRMVGLARSVGADVVFVQPAVNLKDFSPFKSEHGWRGSDGLDAEWDRLFAAGHEALARGRFEQARTAFGETLLLDNRFADAHYQLGRALFALELFPEAESAFQRGVTEDVCPLRILPEMNDVIASVAENEGVALIDFRAALRAQCLRHQGNPILGEASFLDHVHPRISVHRALGRLLLDHLIRKGIVNPGLKWGDAVAEQIAVELERSVDQREHAVARGVLAKVLRWAGKTEESDRLLDSAADVLRDDAEGCALLGARLERQGNLDEAARLYERAIGLDDGLDEARLHLARVRRLQSRGEDAVVLYRKVLRRNPDLVAAHNGLGVALSSLGRTLEAVPAFQRTIELDPTHPRAHTDLGMLYARQKRYDDALLMFDRAIRVNPRSIEAMAQMSAVLKWLGRKDESLEMLQRALAVAPNDPGLHNAMGLSFDERDDLTNAIDHYRRAIDAKAEFAEAHFHLGVALARLGDLPLATEHLERAIALSPRMPPAYLNLGLAYLKLGDHERAANVYRRALETWPDDTEMLLKRAWILSSTYDVELRDGAEALRLASAAIDAGDKVDPRHLEVLGAAHAATGEFRRAVETAERALRIAEQTGASRLARRLERQLGQYRAGRPLMMTNNPSTAKRD